MRKTLIIAAMTTVNLCIASSTREESTENKPVASQEKWFLLTERERNEFEVGGGGRKKKGRSVY